MELYEVVPAEGADPVEGADSGMADLQGQLELADQRADQLEASCLPLLETSCLCFVCPSLPSHLPGHPRVQPRV